MESVLADCRRLFGPPPRRFSILDWAYLHFERPPFTRDVSLDTVDPSSNLAGFLIDERDQELLRREGHVAWGALVHANTALFAPGVEDHGAVMVTSLDPAFDGAPDRLLQIARALKIKERRPRDPEVLRIGAALDHEHVNIVHARVPDVLAGDCDVRCTDLFVHRRHLPDIRLVTSFFPVITAPGRTPSSVVLPARFWPEDLVAAWVTGDVRYLRPSARAAFTAIKDDRRYVELSA